MLTVSSVKLIKEDKPSKHILDIINKLGLPIKEEQEGLELILENSNVAFVNAIRRSSGLPVRIMTCDQKDVDTNDTTIIGDDIKCMIEQIPINQDTKITSLKLYKHNNTENIVPITSHDILVDGEKSKIFIDVYLGDLCPFKTIEVDLVEQWGTRNTSKIFTYEGNIAVVSIELENYEKDNKSIPSSLEFEPSLFKLTVPKQYKRVASPKQIIINICDHYIHYCDQLLEPDTKLLEITKNNEFSIYKFVDYIDIGLLMEHYIYDLDNSIKKIYSEQIDMALNVFIYHNNITPLYNTALKNIKRDFNILKDSCTLKKSNMVS